MSDQCKATDGSGTRCALVEGHAGWHGPAPAATPSAGWAPAGVSDGKLDTRGTIALVFAAAASVLIVAWQLSR